MNSDSLKKPVDLQGLSLALAKTKADYMAKNQQLGDDMEQYIKDYVSSNAGDKTWYGYCTTNSTTRDKVVNINGFTSDKLVAGVKVVIGFHDGNAIDSPRLNVSSTGAKPIITSGISINSSQMVNAKDAEVHEWNTGIITFVYDGYGQWIMESQQHATTSYFGVTKLSNTISNDSTTALTPSAVYANVLTKTNTTSYTPTEDYHPATKQYVDSATSGITTNLAGLTDTTITSPSGGQVLTYDGTNNVWVNGESSGAYYVTFTLNNDTYTADKTFDEVYAAYQSGKTVFALNGAEIYCLALANANGLAFCKNGTTQLKYFSWAKSNNAIHSSIYNLTNYQTKLTFDSAPTANSTNPVTSGGVYTALQSAGTTYSLSLSGSTITLTGSDGSTSSINLPIYDGSVTEVWTGGVY